MLSARGANAPIGFACAGPQDRLRLKPDAGFASVASVPNPRQLFQEGASLLLRVAAAAGDPLGERVVRLLICYGWALLTLPPSSASRSSSRASRTAYPCRLRRLAAARAEGLRSLGGLGAQIARAPSSNRELFAFMGSGGLPIRQGNGGPDGVPDDPRDTQSPRCDECTGLGPFQFCASEAHHLLLGNPFQELRWHGLSLK